MKKSIIIVAATLMSLVAVAANQTDIKEGRTKQDTIIVEVSGTTNTTYIAESARAASVLDAVWLCYRIQEWTSGTTNVTIISVMADLQAPGTNGVNLAGFTY